ncbi:MAG: 3-hydroxyacyl-CoA dehydrogenase NAD-binding domain-containing protein, partial [Bacteroidota bacterium]
MKNIAVIGSGTMGNGIAHVFAQNGFNVSLIDIRQDALDKAISTISANLDRMISKGTIGEDVKAATLSNLKTFTSLKDGISNSDLVVEAATENIS